MKILYIDTSGDKAKIGLVEENKSKLLEFGPKHKFSEKLLSKIDKLLKENELSPQKLSAIAVFKGPGSFTGLRIGIATANALAFSLNIPIIEISEADLKSLPKKITKKFHSKKFTKIATPFYGRPPHITKPKKKKASNKLVG